VRTLRRDAATEFQVLSEMQFAAVCGMWTLQHSDAARGPVLQ
jgi:hypothetical protein